MIFLQKEHFDITGINIFRLALVEIEKAVGKLPEYNQSLGEFTKKFYGCGIY